MRVLLVGAGGREHALAWALSASPLIGRLWVAPGNPGTAELAENVLIAPTDIPALVAFAARESVDLVVPGPEAPLALGLADACAAAGLRCFGPTRAAAALETSKSFMKEVAEAAGVPTARWAAFDDPAAARAHLACVGAPVVVKADGLAAGKGVVVATTLAEAEEALADAMERGLHGEAGRRVVIEECLAGEEVSFFALCDGTDALPFAAAADHKRVGEGDTGPNTGGMGAYSPPPAFTPALQAEVMRRMIRPTLAEMARRGTPFRGVLFAGLMLAADGPKLLEYNVRFGDPETQAMLPRLRSDLLSAMLAACDGELARFDLRWSAEASLAVVLAARGYPAAPETGSVIEGVEDAAATPGALLFHAGTRRDADGTLRAAGGRVLTVVGTGPDLRAARDAAYAAVDRIRWPGGFCRRDIGARALG
ncbi:MAG: phosphoribosylamine--glycine ligase [Acetobacteraceae bacterium]|nr:phosphoribosylamine--glycine ligase [Acetobacteraceae bacterium]